MARVMAGWQKAGPGGERRSPDPYVDWFWRDHPTERQATPADTGLCEGALRAFLESARTAAQGGDVLSDLIAALAKLAAAYDFGRLVPLAPGSKNPDPALWSPAALARVLPEVDADTVIVGAIDTGISLCHDHFRDADGHSRFVAAWQQSAPCPHTPGPAQRQLPFGEELYQADIDAALATHTHPGGWLDEDGFNRGLHLVAPEQRFGQRDLDHRAAHGTHVLDLAAGFPPGADSVEAMRRQKIIAVNLPPQQAHGTAGNFLPYFAILALFRTVFLADALWHRNNPKAAAGGEQGYPIVVNFAFGMQAGPKDGAHIFEQFLELLPRLRAARGMTSPLRVVLPAGNDAQARAVASARLGQGKDPSEALARLDLPWRLQPADHTANYLEIWFEKDCVAPLLKDLALFITPPGSPPLRIRNLEPGAWFDLTRPGEAGPFARLYCEVEHQRLRLVLCTAPTARNGAAAVLAPAGAWALRFEFSGPPVGVDLYVQSDQSAVRTSKNGRRAYFDHPAYDTHVTAPRRPGESAAYPAGKLGPLGGLRDAYHYDLAHETWPGEHPPDYGPVQRSGSHNAIATLDQGDLVLCIGGHDALSGRPAVYGGATTGQAAGGRALVTASLPSEAAPMHFGLLAAGARSGAAMTWRGTSMACALASREILSAFCGVTGKNRAKKLAEIGSEGWMRARAQAREAASRSDPWGRPICWPVGGARKTGAGRLDLPESFRAGRVPRLGVDEPPQA